MPDVTGYENENDWMGVCVPVYISEGKDQDQAVAICMSEWRNRKSVKAAQKESYEESAEAVREAFDMQFNPMAQTMPAEMPEMPHVKETYPGYVIACINDVEYRIPYTKDGEIVQFAPRMEWVEVEEQWIDVKGGPGSGPRPSGGSSEASQKADEYINSGKLEKDFSNSVMAISGKGSGTFISASGNVDGNPKFTIYTTDTTTAKALERKLTARLKYNNSGHLAKSGPKTLTVVLLRSALIDAFSGKSILSDIYTDEHEHEDALKIGRRNSYQDAQHLQTAHDSLVKAGAVCGPSGKSIEVDDALVSFGESVKATQLEDGSVKLAGYLVRYSTENDPDVTGDFFTKNTDFGEMKLSDAWFNHRLPVKFGNQVTEYKEKLSAKAKLIEDDAGVFAEIVIKARNAYEKQIAELGLAGKLGWSSGTAAHLVDRRPAKNGAQEITRWILGLDASLTPTPAEPRNMVMPIKSLFTPELAAVAVPDEVKNLSSQIISKKEKDTMEENDLKNIASLVVTELKPVIADASKTAAESAVKAYQEASAPAVKAGNVTGFQDEADKALAGNPFKTGEFWMAVKNAAVSPYDIDMRLRPLQAAAKATGMAEGQPSQAGFLVQQNTAAGIVEKMYGTGTLLSLFTNKDPVTRSNNMTYNIVDESSRANGSRYGGLTGYWLNEGGTITSSKPRFRQLELKLKKVTALCVATDEQLNDAPSLDSFLMRNVPQELRFKVEDAIINGDGVGKPRGILGSPAFVSATRADANLIAAGDIGRMWASRWAGANDYIWLGNQSIFPQLLTMSIGQQPVFLPPGGISNLPYATLLGRPYYDIEYAPALGTLGDLVLVSPSQYQLIDNAGGVQAATSIHVYFTTEEQAYRFSYRVDGAPIWDAALTGFDAVSRSPFVGLAAST